MSRFIRLSSKFQYKYAQEEVNQDVLMQCPKCQQWFKQKEIQQSRAGRMIPGHYVITCLHCHKESPAGSYKYWYPEQSQNPSGYGVRLDNNQIVNQINTPLPPPR